MKILLPLMLGGVLLIVPLYAMKEEADDESSGVPKKQIKNVESDEIDIEVGGHTPQFVQQQAIADLEHILGHKKVSAKQKKKLTKKLARHYRDQGIPLQPVRSFRTRGIEDIIEGGMPPQGTALAGNPAQQMVLDSILESLGSEESKKSTERKQKYGACGIAAALLVLLVMQTPVIVSSIVQACA